MAAERWTLAVAKHARATQGRILAYHSVGTPSWGVNDVTPRDFERHLQVAVDDGWSFVTPAQVLADPGARMLALTFDDGITSVLTNAAPVLRHHGLPATAFVVTGWADGRYHGASGQVLDWAGVRALQTAGFTLASHSVTHPDFGRLGVDAARFELDESRRRLREMTGVETSEFAIPLGQARHWSAAATEAASEAGYSTVYAQSADKRPAGTVARTFITGLDRPRLFRAALGGAFDGWDEWF
jgi:peptidoglycan/xylan/chitin deacetylase (PgdA/CDA1 family)